MADNKKAAIQAKIKELQELLNLSDDDEQTEADKARNTVDVHFNEREICKLPKDIKQWLRNKNGIMKARKRSNGRYVCSYELRYNRKGYHISASATTVDELKERFIEKIAAATLTPDKNAMPKIPTNFDKFALYWFNYFHKRKVQPDTFKSNLALYNRYIKKRFGALAVKDINPLMLQDFLDGFIDKGKTADDLHSLFNQIFKAAVNHGLIKLNPLGMVFHTQHQRKHGKAISIADEKRLLSAYANTPYQLQFAIALYTGLRPNEWATAVIDGEFIRAKNSKRKGGKTEFKRIPITPMLRPYVNGITELPAAINTKTLEKRFKAILPEHKLYDMRTTFQTRCDECGITDKAIGLFMGNSIGKGDREKEAYTDIEDKQYLHYLYIEGQKLNY